MNYRFIKLPRPCPRTAYETAAQKIALNAIKHPNVVAIYQMGNVGAPGISDLDIIIVVKDAKRFSFDGFFADLTKDEQYTLMHGLFCVNVAFWRNRLLFLKFDNLKLLAGKNIEPVELPLQWLEWAELRFAVQHLIRVYVSLFVQLFFRLLKVRSLLCELNALRYDFDVLSKLLNVESRHKFMNYIVAVQQIRSQWFDTTIDLTTRFLNLCQLGETTLTEIIENLNDAAEIRLKNPPSRDFFGNRTAIINSNRLIVASTSRLLATASWPATVLKFWITSRLASDFAAKLSNHIGHYKIGIPSHVFSYAINSTWQNLDCDRRYFIEKRNEVICANIGTAGNGSVKHALPLLDFIEN